MRTDIHSPKNFDPAAYAYVGSFDNYPEPGSFVSNVRSDFDTPFGFVVAALNYNHAEYRAAHDLMERLGAKIHFVDGNSQCDHCGARIRYVSIYRHSSGEAIAVGDDCASFRFGCADRREYDIKRLKDAAASARESRKAFGAASDFINEQAPELASWMLSPDAAKVGDIFLDMSRRLIKWGSLSPKQLAFAQKLLREYFERQRNGGRSDRELAMDAEREAAANCPNGRVTVTGVIVKIATHEGSFGASVKMTVKDDGGFLVWMTLPLSSDAQKGDRIKVTATVTPSDRDPKFGFGKRPSKMEVLAKVEAA